MAKQNRFAEASDGEIKRPVDNSVPRNRKKSAKYAVNVFETKKKLRIEFSF